jgi:Na+/proline symporter
VARVYWPDLSQIDFFKPYIGQNPQDLVFIGLCLKLLPNGLIGVFLAAMLAATMSTLSSVYNMVSSILSRDIYQGWIRPGTSDEGLLKVGRLFSVALGLFVTVMAVIFVNSQFGIFNLMQEFYTLLNIPVVVPTAFGLLFRRVPKWSAVAAIGWGLLAGLTTRFVLGWDIGPKVYIAFVTSFGIFASSYWLGTLYKKNRMLLWALSAAVAVIMGALWLGTLPGQFEEWQRILAIASALAMALSLVGFAKLFAQETEAERELVREFFRKLDTPVDVMREVFGAGKRQISTFPLVGGTTIVMGLLMSLIFMTPLGNGEAVTLGIIVAVMIVFGILMWYFGKKSEIRSANQYLQNVESGSTGGSTDEKEPG